MVSATPKDMMITVLVVDDHPVVREGLRTILSAEPDIEVLGEAGDGRKAEEAAVRLNPDVIVMDIYMPVRNGIHSLISIKRKLPEVKVLLLTVSEREDDLLIAIRYGADGYILKKGNAEDIVEAVRRIARGETTLPSHITRELVKEMLEKRAGFGLSAREKEVLGLLGAGMTNADIAERLVLSQKTVSTYVYRLLQKLHLRNREEATAYSIRRLKHGEPY